MKSQTTNCRSKTASTAVNNLRKTLIQLETELLNIETLVAFYKEKQLLLAQSNKQKDIQARLDAKVWYENYVHYRNRITKLYNIVIDKINDLSARYEGEFDQVFSLYFLQGKTIEYVCEKVKDKFTPRQVRKIITVIEKELEDF
jgi:hypothetical protein